MSALKNSSIPHLPVSWGEIIDKLTILEIKKINLSNKDALGNVQKELSLITEVSASQLENNETLRHLKQKLRLINEDLWKIEDAIREKEARKEFDTIFIELARSVYKKNDARAAVKKEINTLLKSEIVEEKSYKDYA